MNKKTVTIFTLAKLERLYEEGFALGEAFCKKLSDYK